MVCFFFAVCEFNAEDLMQQIIMEQLISDPDKNLKQSLNQVLSGDEPMAPIEQNELSTKNSVPSLPSDKIDEKSTSNQKESVSSLLENGKSKEMFYKRKLRYLMSCYDRVGTEERTYSKVGCNR